MTYFLRPGLSPNIARKANMSKSTDMLNPQYRLQLGFNSKAVSVDHLCGEILFDFLDFVSWLTKDLCKVNWNLPGHK